MLCLYVWIFVHLVVESLPLSSSGHVSLVEQWCSTLFHAVGVDSGLILHALHAVNIVLLALFFAQRWYFFIKIMSAYSGINYYRYVRYTHWISYIFLLVMAVIVVDTITACFYGAFNYYGMPPIPVYIGFIITGILLLIASLRTSSVTKNILSHKDYSWKAMLIGAIILGCAQSVALLPGISRLGITYTASILLGFSAKHAFEVACMIEWPLIAAASLKALYTLRFLYFPWTATHTVIGAVITSGSIVSWYALHLSWYLMRKNKLWIFSIYLFTVAFILYLLGTL